MKIQEHSTAKIFLQACDVVLNAGHGLADHTACYLLGSSHYLTRYANNQVIQNVRKKDINMVVRVILDGKVGMASCNQLDETTLYQTVKKAVQLSKYSQVNPILQSFPEPQMIPQVYGFDEATEQVSPQQMADAVKIITTMAEKESVQAAGACQVEIIEQAVANSAGIRVYGRRTRAELHTVAIGDSGSGYAVDVRRSFQELNPLKVAQTAIDKCKVSQNPQSIELGEYPVILEPRAVGDLLFYLGMTGFNPVHFHEGRSFLSNRMGYRLFSEKISISEDPLASEGLPVAFDWDGLPKQKVSLIQNGIATGMIYDDTNAQKYGTKSTGNAMFPTDNSFGIHPTHLHLEAGKTSQEAMIAQMDRGILITRFHYLGVIHPKEALITGMTRGGTFLIENGQIVAPLKNLRFTESLIHAFQHVLEVGNESIMTNASSSIHSITRAPSLMISKFRFTGITNH